MKKQNKHDYWRIFGNAFLEIEPIKNLVLKTNFGMNYYDETNKNFLSRHGHVMRSIS